MKNKIKNFIKKWDWLGCVLKVINIKLAVILNSLYSDEKFIIRQYKRRTGKVLDINNPKTFNEKIQWLKINYKNEIMHACVDKYEVRNIVKEKIGEDILIKNYGVWDKFEDINFDELPNEFILKLTNGSSFNYICTNKTKREIRKMRRRFKMWQKVDYYKYAKEWAYKGVKNRIICEELLKPSSGEPPNDYRFFCFNGKVHCFSVDYDSVVNGIKTSDYKRNIYTVDGNKMDAVIKYPNKKEIKEEKNALIKKMIEYAEILSKGFPQARIDFYCFDGKIYFGEITFYHASGYQKMYPASFEVELGALIQLNDLANIKPSIGIIGHFGGDKTFLDGQTIKTKEINSYFENYYSITTMKFDTYKNARNPFKLFFGIKKLLKHNEVVCVILSTRGYKIVLPIINMLNKLYKKTTLDFVIGGNRYKIYKNKFLKAIARKTDKIYVETEKIKKGYETFGFQNVEVLPNFKNLHLENLEEYKEKDIIKFCTFSRVCKEKGISDALELVNQCNKLLGEKVFHLDIYGQIDENYKEELEEKLNTCKGTVEYKGMVAYNKSTEVLKEYDMMLFLTYWQGEGFPGTIVDALFSGLPVMATDWNYNFDILREDYTGIKVDINDIEKMKEQVIHYYNNQNKLYEMKKNCLNEAKNYLPDQVMKQVIEYIEREIKH